MEHKKAQVAIEFLIVIGALFFFIALFMLTIQENTREETYKRENILVKEIALTVGNEINLASESEDGYSREFEIPEKAGGLDYEIVVDSEMIYIRTLNDRHALAIPIRNITGDVNITSNRIEKINGMVYLNE